MNLKQISIAALLAVTGIAANAGVTGSLGGDTNPSDFITFTQNTDGGSTGNVFNGSIYSYVPGTAGLVYDSNGNVIAKVPDNTLGTQFMASGPSHGNGSGQSLLLNLPSTNYISFDWGSVDSFNSLVFTFTDGSTQTIHGSDIPGVLYTLPNQTTYEVSFTSTLGIKSVQFDSSSNAFEVSDVSVTAVPEPSNIALMLAGLGAFGLVARKRRV